MNSNLNIRKNVVSSALAFLVSVLLVLVTYRLVLDQGGLKALGVWTILTAWIQLIRIGDIGMSSAVIRFVSQCRANDETIRIRQYIETGVVLNTAILAALASLSALLYSSNLSRLVPSGDIEEELLQTLLPPMFVSLVLSNMVGVVIGGLGGLHRTYQAALVVTFGSVIQLVVAVALVPQVGLLGLAWAQVVQHAAVLVLAWLLVIRALRAESKPGDGGRGWLPRYLSRNSFREMINFSLKSQLVNILNGLFEPVSRMIVGKVGGLEVLGQYELAYKIISLPRSAVVSGAHATVPALTKLVESDPVAAGKLYRQTRSRLRLIGLPVLGGAALLAPVASSLWLGRIDWQLVIFAGILAVGFARNTLSVASYLVGVASGNVWGNIISSIVVLGVLLIFMPVMAVLGQPLITILILSFSIAVGGIVVDGINRKIIPERLRRI
jgi:O-antigen/teichoic acid export membrane protein